MLSRTLRSLAFIAAAAACATTLAQAQQPSQILDIPGGGKIRVVTVATGLFHPWSIAFTPDGGVLVAERDGKLRIIRNGVMAPEPVWTSPTPRGTAADSLHGLAVHPKFAQNHLVYVSYPKLGPKGNTLAVSRGRLEGDKNAMTPKNPIDYVGGLKALVIGFYGGKDTGISAESIERMRASLKVTDDPSQIIV